jgi:hypothetical protein
MFFITFLSFYFIIYFLLGFIFSSNKETKPIFDQNDKNEEELVEKDVLNNSFKKTYYFTSYDDIEEDTEDEEESYYSYEEDNEDETEDTLLDYYMRSQFDITSWEYWTFGSGVEED